VTDKQVANPVRSLVIITPNLGCRNTGILLAISQLLALQPSFGSSDPATAWMVTPSQTTDLCLLLNALSDDPIFSRGYEMEKPRWLPAIKANKEISSAFTTCQSHGIQLAYFLGPSRQSLNLFLREPRLWHHLARKELDEPTYRSELEFIFSHHSEFAKILNYFLDAGFDQYWNERINPELQLQAASIKHSIEDKIQLSTIQVLERFTKHFLKTASDDPLRVHVGYFNGPYNFTQSGGEISLRHDLAPDEAPSAVIHEWLHSFNPRPMVIRLHRKLRMQSRFYADAWDRIYVVGREGEEEEFIIAAEMYIDVLEHLRSNRSALLYVKSTYGGLPLAGLLFSRLIDTYPKGPPIGFDYNHFLKATLTDENFAPERIKQSSEQVIDPVSGSAGLRLNQSANGLAVVQIYPGSGADKAGLSLSDVLLEVNGKDTKSLPMDTFEPISFSRRNCSYNP